MAIDTATMIQIIEAIVTFATLLGLSVVAKLYLDTKKLVDILKGALGLMGDLNNEYIEANKDGKVTDAEFASLLESSKPVYDKIVEAMNQAKLVVDDVEALVKQVQSLINDWQTKKATISKR
jgi:uncharacterized protein YdcH (DUF465 family)